MIRLATAALFSLAMASCAATPTPEPTPATCQGAFAVTDAAEGLRPQLEALNQTVRTYGSIEEWEAMYTRFGDYWHYTDEARTVLTNMCLYSTEVNRTPFVCTSRLR
jgi:hypothetical protein